jgi:hypothetical protein
MSLSFAPGVLDGSDVVKMAGAALGLSTQVMCSNILQLWVQIDRVWTMHLRQLFSVLAVLMAIKVDDTGLLTPSLKKHFRNQMLLC